MNANESAHQQIEDQIAEWLRGTFGGFVGIATARIDRMQPLLAGEEAAIANSVERRRIEFSTGRWCAREALKHSGVEPQPILVGPRGAPVWPHGSLGAITHTGGVCAAVAASTEEVEGLGIDIVDLNEARGALVTTASVFTDEAERAAATAALAPLRDVAVGPDTDDALVLAVLFSAKETAIKAMTEALTRYVEFTDVKIHLEESSFSAHLVPEGLSVMGWWTVCSGFVVTAAARH